MYTYVSIYVRFSRMWMILVLRWDAIAIGADARKKLDNKHEGQKKTIRTNERQFETCYTDCYMDACHNNYWLDRKRNEKKCGCIQKIYFFASCSKEKKKREKIKIEREKRKRERKRESNVLDSLSKNKFLFYYWLDSEIYYFLSASFGFSSQKNGKKKKKKIKYGQMNNRLILSCRDEIKQNFMAHSYAGDLPIEIIYIVNLIDPYARCAGEFRSLKKEKKSCALSSRKLIKQNWKIWCDENVWTGK